MANQYLKVQALRAQAIPYSASPKSIHFFFTQSTTLASNPCCYVHVSSLRVPSCGALRFAICPVLCCFLTAFTRQLITTMQHFFLICTAYPPGSISHSSSELGNGDCACSANRLGKTSTHLLLTSLLLRLCAQIARITGEEGIPSSPIFSWFHKTH